MLPATLRSRLKARQGYFVLCNCERDAAIHVVEKDKKLDCRVTSFLAKTLIIWKF